MNKILWLDDEWHMFQELALILNELDFEIINCQNILEANEVLKTDNAISLIILDLNLPPVGLLKDEIAQTEKGTLTGYVFYEKYVYPKYKDIPVVIFSAIQLERYIDNEIVKNVTCVNKWDSIDDIIKVINKKCQLPTKYKNNSRDSV